MHAVNRLTVSGNGLWKQRADLSNLLDAKILFCPQGIPHKTNGFLGWGDKPSSDKAETYARRAKKPFIKLEDGFLRSWNPGVDDKSASFVVDHTGIYYNARQPSDLETTLQNSKLDSLHDRAKSAISEIIQNRLSKYNNAPIVGLKSLGLEGQKFILLVDQVAGDQSINGSLANSTSFHKMLIDASLSYPDHKIVIKAHPASKKLGPLVRAAKKYFKDCLIITEKVNLWPLIESCDHFYTVSSQTGFEALMAGVPVTCYGIPFYSGWGATNDILKTDRRTADNSVLDIFAGSYIQYTRYLSLHDRKPTTLENVIDELSVICKARRVNRSPFVTVGLSRHKRMILEPFLINTAGKPSHVSSIMEATALIKKQPDTKICVWGQNAMNEQQHAHMNVTRLEDGFIRSQGLGAAFTAPSSIILDDSGFLHFNCHGSSNLEELATNFPFTDEHIKRAQSLQSSILDNRITKYMMSGLKSELPETSKIKILVPGQVETDASIKFGSPETKTNTQLLKQVRAQYPDAFIAFKEHPDVAKGLRPGKVNSKEADLIVTDYDIIDLIDWCDRVETMTSLTGFEALMRGKEVGTHGYPFYAGWGFTTDRISNSYMRKRRQLPTLQHLIYLALIEYPAYIHPLSKLPCKPEVLLEYFKHAKPTILDKFRTAVGTFLGRIRLQIFRR